MLGGTHSPTSFWRFPFRGRDRCSVRGSSKLPDSQNAENPINWRIDDRFKILNLSKLLEFSIIGFLDHSDFDTQPRIFESLLNARETLVPPLSEPELSLSRTLHRHSVNGSRYHEYDDRGDGQGNPKPKKGANGRSWSRRGGGSGGGRFLRGAITVLYKDPFPANSISLCLVRMCERSVSILL